MCHNEIEKKSRGKKSPFSFNFGYNFIVVAFVSKLLHVAGIVLVVRFSSALVKALHPHNYFQKRLQLYQAFSVSTQVQ